MRALIDTGAPGSVLPRSIADAVGIELPSTLPTTPHLLGGRDHDTRPAS
jgi:predicted aspartyl protease